MLNKKERYSKGMGLQKKTFILVFSCITAVILSGIAANYLFLERYYLYKTRLAFITMSQTIQEQMDSRQVKTYIENEGKENDLRIIIMDKDWKIENISYYQREDKSNIPLKKIKELAKKKGNKDYICEVYERTEKRSTKMIFLSEMENEKFLILMKNTDGIRESARIASEFYLFLGGVFLLMGGLAASFFSKKITLRILRIKNVAAEITQLNFEHRIEEKGNDEIQELAHSINVLSEKLHNSIKSLQQDILQRKQLVRDVSHELKTPIAVIKGYADGLQYGVAQDDASREKYCSIISAECDRMNDMIKELLELSRLEQLSIESILEPVLFYPFLKNILEKYTKILEEKKCSLFVQCKENQQIIADKRLLERCIDNLISNAVFYVNMQGTIEITLQEEEKRVKIQVFNSGSHISEDDLDKIWNVFYKADKSRKREGNGHGIGLAIVKSAIECQKGSVFVHNREDGVLFGFFLPKTSL